EIVEHRQRIGVVVYHVQIVAQERDSFRPDQFGMPAGDGAEQVVNERFSHVEDLDAVVADIGDVDDLIAALIKGIGTHRDVSRIDEQTRGQADDVDRGRISKRPGLILGDEFGQFVYDPQVAERVKGYADRTKQVSVASADRRIGKEQRCRWREGCLKHWDVWCGRDVTALFA